jgi:hypothetical protein
VKDPLAPLASGAISFPPSRHPHHGSGGPAPTVAHDSRLFIPMRLTAFIFKHSPGTVGISLDVFCLPSFDSGVILPIALGINAFLQGLHCCFFSPMEAPMSKMRKARSTMETCFKILQLKFDQKLTSDCVTRCSGRRQQAQEVAWRYFSVLRIAQ